MVWGKGPRARVHQSLIPPPLTAVQIQAMIERRLADLPEPWTPEHARRCASFGCSICAERLAVTRELVDEAADLAIAEGLEGDGE